MRQFNTVQEIQEERLKNRNNSFVYTLLGILIGEIDRLPTRATPTPDQIYSVINKMYNNAKEMSQYNEQSKLEVEYFQDFIKKQLTENELSEIINNLIAQGSNNVGQCMKYLNEHYKGQFDGKLAASIINRGIRK